VIPPSLVTRLLHLGVSAGVSLQLLLSTFMERPRPGAVRDAAEALGFTLHEVIGGFLLSVLLGWFAWAALRRSEPNLSAFFPWLRAEGRREVLRALRRALADAARRRLASEAELLPLVRTVHGLGVLCALFMATTGALVWWGMAASGTLSAWAAVVLDLHQGAASLMWAYLLGHAGMALLHQWRGEAILGRMFSLRGLRQGVE
jgi:cytochrome b561